MKKLLFHSLIVFLLFAGAACNDNATEQTEEGEIPVSAEDPRAPTVAPDKPTTDVGDGLEDSIQTEDQVQDNL